MPLSCCAGVSPDNEIAIFACEFEKHRTRGFSHSRHMLITTRAIYNFEPRSYTKANRVIEIRNINGIILSTSSLQMLINVRDDYDFHLTASTETSRQVLIGTIQDAYDKLQLPDMLAVTYEKSPDLAPISVPADRVTLRSSLDAKLALKRKSELVRETDECFHMFLVVSTHALFYSVLSNSWYLLCRALPPLAHPCSAPNRTRCPPRC